jgi:hypothetical protein
MVWVQIPSREEQTFDSSNVDPDYPSIPSFLYIFKKYIIELVLVLNMAEIRMGAR